MSTPPFYAAVGVGAALHILLLDVDEALYHALCENTDTNTTYSRGTAAIFLHFPVLDTTYPVLAPCPPRLPFVALAASSQVVSSGDDATLSRSVRPSIRSRRGRHGCGRSPRSTSPDATRRIPAREESGDAGSPVGEASGAGTSNGSSHRCPGLSAPREMESQRRVKSDGEQSLSDEVAHPRQPSARSAERHRRVSPSSAARLRQGSCRSRDARDGFVDVAAEAERTGGALEETQATTLGVRGVSSSCTVVSPRRGARSGRLLRRQQRRNSLWTESYGQRRWEILRVPHLPSAGSANLRSPSPGDEALLDGIVQFMASSPRVKLASKLGAAVVAKAPVLLTSVRRTLFSRKLQSIRRAWSGMGPCSWQGQLRAGPAPDLVTALRVAHDEAQDTVLWPTPQEEQEELCRTQNAHNR